MNMWNFWKGQTGRDAVTKSRGCIALLFICILASCSFPVTFHKNLADIGQKQPSSQLCRECHTAIYDEWRLSAHSRAYTNEFYRSITNEYRISVCISCHSPANAFSQEIMRREANPEEGVHCQTCHLRNGMLQGPVEKQLPFDIHPIMEKNMDYLKSSLCGNCHKKTFEEYRDSGEKNKTCQDCHMPEIKRTIIDNRPWVWLKDTYTFKKHSFNIQDTKEISDKISISLDIKDSSLLSGDVTVENKSVPHNIPTGGYGYHEALVNISLLDAAGAPLEKKTYSMTQEMKTSLKSGEKRKIPFTFSVEHESRSSVKVVFLKTDSDRKEMQVISQKTFNLQ